MCDLKLLGQRAADGNALLPIRLNHSGQLVEEGALNSIKAGDGQILRNTNSVLLGYSKTAIA